MPFFGLIFVTLVALAGHIQFARASVFASGSYNNLASSVHNSSLIRNVTGGEVEGFQEPIFGTYVFKGVPFAAPPVGSLRFQPAAPVQAWSGVLLAKSFSAGCMQSCILPQPDVTCPATMSEDCLYLNIWTPELDPPEPLPVMIFIHGGAFVQGSAGVPLYDAANLARTQRIVYVAGNYRLGLFGALHTNTVAGNFMLSDQRQLMRWVQANIREFGGDPRQVTIAGQSAGAMSVGAHVISPLSEGLFRAGIMDSNPYGLLFANRKLALELGGSALEKLGCENTTGPMQFECLQAIPADGVLAVSNSTRNFPYPNDVLATMVPWTPLMDGVEVPVQPIFANRSSVPVMMGTQSNDSVPFINALAGKPLANWELDLLLGYVFGVKIAIELKQLYGAPPNVTDTRIYFSGLATDYMFFCPNRFVARKFASTQPAFRYLFSHLPTFSKWMWHKTDPLCEEMVCHADDLPFVFNNAYATPEAPRPTPDEQQLMIYMQKTWGNFVRFLNPNGPTGDQRLNPPFPKYDAATDSTLSFQLPQSLTVELYNGKFCDYFDSIGYDRY